MGMNPGIVDLGLGYTAMRRPNGRYAVFDPAGTPIGERMDTLQATNLATSHQRRAKRKTRPCLCCNRPFTSTGPGHRMCKGCREKSEGLI